MFEVITTNKEKCFLDQQNIKFQLKEIKQDTYSNKSIDFYSKSLTSQMELLYKIQH